MSCITTGRFYDPSIMRFLSPDSTVPLATQGTQALDRYAYVNNNPVRYNDPKGHDIGCPGEDGGTCAEPPPPEPVCEVLGADFCELTKPKAMVYIDGAQVEYTFLTVSGDTETTQFGDKPAISVTTENITYEAFYSAKVYDGAISVTIEENWNISFDPISSDTTVWTNIRVPSETAPEPYLLTLGPITAVGDGARITRDIPIPGGSVDSTPFVEIVIYTPSAFLGSDIFRYLFLFYR